MDAEAPVSDMVMSIESFSPPIELMSRPMQAGIHFRPCRVEQFDELIAFHRSRFDKYPGWMEMHENLKTTDNVADAILALNQEGRIVGSVLAFSPLGSSNLAKDIPWLPLIGDRCGGIACVGVEPEHRRFGVGLGMVCEALNELKRRGLKSCIVDWVFSRGMYERCGFQTWRNYREAWWKV